MLRQFFAIVLVALVLAPFTAPFATCDLAFENPLHQADALSGAKVAKDTGAIPSFAISDAPSEPAEQFHLISPSLAGATGQARSLVLRL
jgi:hypothetical protein